MRRLACHGHPPGNAVQIQPDIVRRTVHIAVLCRKMAQFIQRFFAYKSAQRGQADLNALLSAAQHGFKQLLLLRQHELFCGQLPLHQIACKIAPVKMLRYELKENIIMKMISRRDFLKASAVVGATAAMTACGGSSSTSTAASSVAASSAAASSAAATNGSANIGVCIYQFADNFMTLYRSDLEEYLKDMGYSVTIMDGKNDQNTQTEQINTFLQQGVDVLVINPVQTTSAQTIVDTVSPSGTPIVFINREPEESVLDSYKGKCCYVGADARQSGTYQGELILETETQGDINGDGKITYIMCKGDPENIDAQYRTEYSIKALTDANKEVECLYEYLDNWDQTTAQQDVANALSQYGDKIEVVFCNNDAMALGALQSIQQAGRTVGKDIYLVGVDALAEAVQDVLDGNMTGTVLNDDVGQATKAAEATKLFVEGKDVEKYYWVDYVKVTKDNASQYLKED